MEVKITNFGGIIVSIKVPDRQGTLTDVVLGFDSLVGYIQPHPYFGTIVGRYGNRIAGGRFSINGDTYSLARNNGPNSLHGGLVGFDKKLWEAEAKNDENEVGLILRHRSPDGDEGFPGNLNVCVTYILTSTNELQMEYRATTDKTTVANLTNHTYFNLTGNGERGILGHEAKILADAFLPVNENLIPTGELRPVSDSPFDFCEAKKIGKDIQSDGGQFQGTRGFDHCWVLRKNGATKTPKLAAEVFEPESGRILEVLTTEPGIQFYTGNFLDGKITGKNGHVYRKHSGFCLETQHFPDSPNQPHFPSTLLRPGEVYETVTVYRFSVR